MDGTGATAVLGHWSLLLAVMANLVGNAIVHAPAASRVMVKVQARRGRCTVTVEDEGTGLPPDVLALIDKGDWRALMSARPGSGFGLATVASVVAAHGGSLSAWNLPTHLPPRDRGTFRGACVQVALPAVPASTSNIIRFPGA